MTNIIDDNFKHSIIEHMNSDHADALVLYIKAFANEAGFTPDESEESAISVTMTDIDETGISLEVLGDTGAHSPDSNVNIKFSDAVSVERLTRAEDVRSVLVLMTKQARVLIENRD